MEVVVSRDALLAEVAAAQAISSQRTTIPILSNLLIEAHDGILKISASNLEQTLTTKAPAKVKKAGVATVPARKLYDYLKLLPPGDLSIKLLDNDWIRIQAGRSNTKMVGMARDSYPAIPTIGSLPKVTVSSAAFARPSHRPCLKPGRMLRTLWSSRPPADSRQRLSKPELVPVSA